MNCSEIPTVAQAYGIELDGRVESYEVLADCVNDVMQKNIPGLVCEVGIRLGYGIFTMMCTSESSRFYIGIDPYGEIDYTDIAGTHKTDYTNDLRNRFLKNIYTFCNDKHIHFSLFTLEDAEFYKRFADGIPIYNKEKSLEQQYAVVHIDGQHSLEAVKLAAEFFAPRISVGGYIAFDNTNHYDHSIVDTSLTKYCYLELNDINGKSIVKTDQEKRIYRRI